MNNETDNRSGYCLYYYLSQTTFILLSPYLYVFTTLILKVSKHSLYLEVKFYRITWGLY